MNKTTTIHPICIKYFWAKMLLTITITFLIAIAIGAYVEGSTFEEAFKSRQDMFYLTITGYLIAIFSSKIIFKS